MKVSTAIRYLSELNPDDDIVIAWWDRDWVQCTNLMQGHSELTVEEMRSIADNVEEYDWVYSSVCDAIEEETRDVLLDRDTVADRRNADNV